MIDLSAHLQRQAAVQPARPAFTWDGGEISYAGLLRRVAGAAEALAALPPVVGLLVGDGIDWVVADLAASLAGKTLVPIPTFFSRQQVSHLIQDAGVSYVLTDPASRPLVDGLGIPCGAVPRQEASTLTGAPGAQRIIYTSGSSGTPKGVRLAAGQIGHSVRALAEASDAAAEDRHLSVLPFALLLEQICGIHLVLHAGASCHIAAGAAEHCAQGDPGPLLRACESRQPTTTVLVPQLLAALVAGVAAGGRTAPGSLRFVATGGAAVPAALLQAAWQAGIPACVGYGLTECCSVVSVSRPGSRSHSAGPPLPGVGVAIEAGEIVVSGPTVMQGYLGGQDPQGRWPTGDLGHFDEAGNLVVVGRKDNLLVTANGRNVSPEWVEAMIERDPRVGRCVVICNDAGELTAVVAPSPSAAVQPTEAAMAAVIRAATAEAPAYARPKAGVIAPEDSIVRAGLLTPKGEPRRAAFAQHFNNPSCRHFSIEESLESLKP